jgi:hypothetical protein
MTPAEIQKESGKGKYKGIVRSEIFNLKIRAKSPFTLTNGSKVVATKWDSAKKILFAGSRQIPLSQIKKDDDMGGGGGSGAGADVTAAVESGQCFVSSIVFNVLKRKIVWEDLSLENLNKAAQYCYTNISLDVVIEKSPTEWIQSYIKTANITFEKYKMAGSPVYFHRGSSFMQDIYKAKKVVMDNDKKSDNTQAPGSFSDDKWNPGDIWMTTLGKNVNDLPELTYASWPDLNKQIYELAQKNKLLGVSLKKVEGKAKKEESNIPGVVKTKYKFDSYRLEAAGSKGSFFNSIDMYMTISGIEVQFRATNTTESWQGEAQGGAAAAGKIGGGNINEYLKHYKLSGKTHLAKELSLYYPILELTKFLAKNDFSDLEIKSQLT